MTVGQITRHSPWNIETDKLGVFSLLILLALKSRALTLMTFLQRIAQKGVGRESL